MAASPPELQPGEVDYPPYALVDDLVKQRERIFGVTGSSLLTTTGQERLPTASGAAMDIARRSKTIRNREIRLRRMLLVEPRIPDAYAKTTQRVRAGQSLLGDMALRLPATLLHKPYQVRVQPFEDEDDARMASTALEDFIHSFLLGKPGTRALLDRGKTSVWRDMMDNLISAGEGCFLLQERKDKWSEDNPRHPQMAWYADDTEAVPASRRKSANKKYVEATDKFRRARPPFTVENLDPQMVYVVEDYEGREDEAIIVSQRPYRSALAHHGLMPFKGGNRQAPDVYQSGDKRRYYVAGPNGLGAPYPIRDFPTGRYLPESVQTVSYFCSAERAFALGLTDGSDPDLGVWAHYVDGVCVDWGGLWGPEDHPLPVFASPGLSSAIPDPNFKGIPALMHLLELADVMDQIFTMELHIAYWSAFPPVLEEDKSTTGGGATGLPDAMIEDPLSVQRPGGAGAGGPIVYLAPGQYYPVPAGKTLRYFTLPPEATVHLERLYEKAQGLWDLLGIPGVFRGSGGAQQPGYAIAQLTIAARSLFDPLVDNATVLVAKACKYLLWQIWKRFPEGVSVYAGTSDTRKDGWLHIKPKDIAPDATDAGTGTPWLELTVSADPLLPTDEALMETRGQNAVEKKMMDRISAMEKYYKDPSPEKTMARMIAQQAMEHPVSIANNVYRSLVRSGELIPILAVQMYAKEFGVDPMQALQQFQAAGVLSPQQAQDVTQVLNAQAAAASAQAGGGGPPQGQPGVTPPGVPNIPPPGPPQGAGAPTPPPPPAIQMGERARLPAPAAGGAPVQMPTQARQAQMIRG